MQGLFTCSISSNLDVERSYRRTSKGPAGRHEESVWSANQGQICNMMDFLGNQMSSNFVLYGSFWKPRWNPSGLQIRGQNWNMVDFLGNLISSNFVLCGSFADLIGVRLGCKSGSNLLHAGLFVQGRLCLGKQTCTNCRTVWLGWWLRLAGPFGPESAHVCWRSVIRSASPPFSHTSCFTCI